MIVGTLKTVDPDTVDTFNYELVDGEGGSDNHRFTVDEETGSVATMEIFDFETIALFSIRVRTTDSTGNSFEKTLPVSVTDENDAPTDLVLDNTAVMEGTADLKVGSSAAQT